MQQNRILIGNSFPLSLMRGHKVVIEEIAMEDFRLACEGNEIVSFWGHKNTLTVAEAYIGIPLKPKCERPAISLNAENYPTLNGESFSRCYVLSPDYCENVRPKIGEEVAADQIKAWHLLQLTWF